MMGRGATPRSAGRSFFAGSGRLLRQAIAVLGITALLLGAGIAGRYVWQMPVQRVAFSGDLQRVSPTRLQTMVNEHLRGGFLSADLQRIRQPVEQLPWVYRVVVKRRWPSSLEIHLTEQLPIARWGEDGYLNVQGEIFRPAVIEPVAELPHLTGPDGSQLLLMQHYKYMQEQMQLQQLQVAVLHMDARGSVTAGLSNGSELVFGRGQLREKLQRFLGVYRSVLATRSKQIRSVDLRYHHGLAVAWRTG